MDDSILLTLSAAYPMDDVEALFRMKDHELLETHEACGWLYGRKMGNATLRKQDRSEFVHRILEARKAFREMTPAERAAVVVQKR